jgi:hypothetical protein
MYPQQPQQWAQPAAPPGHATQTQTAPAWNVPVVPNLPTAVMPLGLAADTYAGAPPAEFYPRQQQGYQAPNAVYTPPVDHGFASPYAPTVPVFNSNAHYDMPYGQREPVPFSAQSEFTFHPPQLPSHFDMHVHMPIDGYDFNHVRNVGASAQAMAVAQLGHSAPTRQQQHHATPPGLPTLQYNVPVAHVPGPRHPPPPHAEDYAQQHFPAQVEVSQAAMYPPPMSNVNMASSAATCHAHLPQQHHSAAPLSLPAAAYDAPVLNSTGPPQLSHARPWNDLSAWQPPLPFLSFTDNENVAHPATDLNAPFTFGADFSMPSWSFELDNTLNFNQYSGADGTRTSYATEVTSGFATVLQGHAPRRDTNRKRTASEADLADGVETQPLRRQKMTNTRAQASRRKQTHSSRSRKGHVAQVRTDECMVSYPLMVCYNYRMSWQRTSPALRQRRHTLLQLRHLTKSKQRTFPLTPRA